MKDRLINRDETVNIGKNLFKAFTATNPLAENINRTAFLTQNYSQEVVRPEYDSDVAEIVQLVKFLNNLVPYKMPLYSFNINDINGEEYYRPDGSLLLVREYSNEIVRDYYVDTASFVLQILEHDRKTGKLRAKIEPVKRKSPSVSTNIIIFDEIINKKYILMQISASGIVSNVTEFSGEGKSFRTLFRNITTYKPARYIEGRDDKKNSFVMIDCVFDSNGDVAKLKKYNNSKEININYSDNKKKTIVKQRS